MTSIKTRVVVIVCVVSVICVGSWSFIQWANSPVKQQISIAEHAHIKKETTQEIVTDFFTTKVPADFQIKFVGNETDPDTVRLVAFESQSGPIQVGITSAFLSSEGLNGVGDYLFRIKENDLYTTISTTQFPIDGSTFENKGGNEVTTFIIHNNRYASISISGQSIASQKVIDIRQLIADNWKWI